MNAEAKEVHDATTPDWQRLAMPSQSQIIFAYIVPFVGAITAYVAFMIGHDAIDQPTPAVERGRMGYLFSLILGLATAAGSILILQRRHVPILIGGLSTALVLGWWAAATAEFYGPGGFLFGGPGGFFSPLASLMLGVVLGGVATGIAAGISDNPLNGPTASAIAGGGTAFGFAGAALYHVATIEQQAEAAALAHESPGLGMVLLIVVIVTTAMLVRRR